MLYAPVLAYTDVYLMRGWATIENGNLGSICKQNGYMKVKVCIYSEEEVTNK